MATVSTIRRSSVVGVEAKLRGAVAAARARGVEIRPGATVVRDDAGAPCECCVLGTLLLDGYGHDPLFTQAVPLLGIDDDAAGAIAADFDGDDEDGYSPRWFDLGRRLRDVIAPNVTEEA
jgi:hypothetical protein